MPRLLLAAVLGLCLPLQSFAWGWLGHRMVGDLAATQLGPRARAQVAELLKGEADPTLGGVASWADELRDLDAQHFRETSNWHYINARGGGCGFEPPRDCPDGNCVVGAIDGQRAKLADRSAPPEVRRDALKFLVHFVGDIHQPLHAGNRTDSGGNRFQVSLRTDIPPEAYARDNYVDGVMGTNLHSIWDYYVLASARADAAKYERRLRRVKPPAGAVAERSPLAWARESCALIDARKLYPDQHVMREDYLRAMRPLAERRIVTAAARLAALLNEALD